MVYPPHPWEWKYQFRAFRHIKSSSAAARTENGLLLPSLRMNNPIQTFQHIKSSAAGRTENGLLILHWEWTHPFQASRRIKSSSAAVIISNSKWNDSIKYGLWNSFQVRKKWKLKEVSDFTVSCLFFIICFYTNYAKIIPNYYLTNGRTKLCTFCI